jgi:hypothetical protein
VEAAHTDASIRSHRRTSMNDLQSKSRLPAADLIPPDGSFELRASSDQLHTMACELRCGNCAAVRTTVNARAIRMRASSELHRSRMRVTLPTCCTAAAFCGRAFAASAVCVCARAGA